MVSLLSRGVGVLVNSLAGLSLTQVARCSSLPGALSAMQCTTARWFSKDISHDLPKVTSPERPPKRPLSSFFLFVEKQRPIVSKSHPKVSAAEIMKVIGKEWRALSEAEKKEYVDAAQVEILKYRDIFKDYKARLHPLDLEILKEERKKKMKSSLKRRLKRERMLYGMPKRNRSAYNIFLSEHYQEAKGNSFTEKLQLIHEDWKNLPSSKKQVYMQLAEDDKVRYQNEIKAWEEQMIEIGRGDLIRRLKSRRLLKKRSERVHKKPGEREEEKASKPAKGRKTREVKGVKS